MSKKFKVTTVAILATLTFATTAFAGIFDVVGAVVGGSNYYAQKAKQSGNSYLEKLAVKIRETGDPDAVFDSVVKEYKDGKYDVNVSETDGGNVKTMIATRSDMLVRAIWILDKHQQTITTKHENAANGSPVGEPITKKYELQTTAVAAQQVDVQKPQNNPSPFASIPFVSRKAVLSADMKNAFEQMPVYLKEKGIDRIHDGIVKEYIQGGKTGCTAFDNCKAIDKPLYVRYAYQQAKEPGVWKQHLESLVSAELKKINDPFSAPKLKGVANELIAYYSAGHSPNLVNINVRDYLWGDVNYIINVYDGDGLLVDGYSLKKQVYTMCPTPAYFPSQNAAYSLAMPVGQVENAYNALKKVFEQNKSVMQNLSKNRGKNMPKQNLTLIRVCKGLNTLCDYKDGKLVYRDAHFSIKTLTFGVSVVNEKQVLDFKNSKWQDLLSATQSNCVVTSFE